MFQVPVPGHVLAVEKHWLVNYGLDSSKLTHLKTGVLKLEIATYFRVAKSSKRVANYKKVKKIGLYCCKQAKN